MTTTPIALVRAQLALPDDVDEALLQHLVATAEEWAGAFLGTRLAEMDAVPASVTHAVLMLVAHWYLCRSSTSETRLSTVPMGVIDLLRPHRQEVTGHDAA